MLESRPTPTNLTIPLPLPERRLAGKTRLALNKIVKVHNYAVLSTLTLSILRMDFQLMWIFMLALINSLNICFIERDDESLRLSHKFSRRDWTSTLILNDQGLVLKIFRGEVESFGVCDVYTANQNLT